MWYDLEDIRAWAREIGPLHRVSRRARGEWLYHSLRSYCGRRKILYLLTPPAVLRNLGDHAQVLGIYRWIDDYLPELPIVEFDKYQVQHHMRVVKRLAGEDDLIVIQSGGNMGNLTPWTEQLRRRIVRSFPQNRIVSLPTTVSFQNTDRGRRELRKSQKAYNSHPGLTLVTRDPESFQRALDHFPSPRVLCCPDFALYLHPADLPLQERRGVLLCLREDHESRVEDSRGEDIAGFFAAQHSEEIYRYNTCIDRDIPRSARREEVMASLRLFASHRLVVTDRLHGLIFSVLARTPCVALPTTDHKVSSFMAWLEGVDYVCFAPDTEDMAEAGAEWMNQSSRSVDVSWHDHFRELADELLLNTA